MYKAIFFIYSIISHLSALFLYTFEYFIQLNKIVIITLLCYQTKLTYSI
ncbi:hypothetical protein S122051_1627 [Staphylococcus aureus subsp. aureus 122051]|nr:hypothetical protein S122051_1627 [Staphylococcus aureus subsp. aureus 122051]EOR47646.1 hypothetical protein M140OLGA_2090 [Staphylococcus aureus subsp. aureus 112808A]